MFKSRRLLGLLAAGTLVLAACGGDSQGRTRNQALPESTDDTTEVSDSTEGAENSDGDTTQLPDITFNSIVVLDNAEVEGQGDGDGSSETSAPAQNFIVQGDGEEGDGEITLEAPEKGGGKRVISNKINICHATGNGDYVEIAVDSNSLNGHGDHANDVIPAPEGGCDSIAAAATTSTSTTTTAPRNPNERRWTDDSLGVMRVSEFYSDGVSASGPGGVMGYIMSNGSILPPGLGLDFKSGRVSGTPTRAGTYSFSMYVSFWGCICGLGKSFSVTVEEPLEPEVEDPTWTDTGLGLLIEGIGFRDGVAAFPKPSSYSVSGALPPGLGFDGATGTISGTPSREGSYSFTVTANYSEGTLSPLSITAIVTPSIAKVWVDDTIAGFVLNTPYSDVVQAKGGGYLDGTMRGVMGYIVGSGSLPAGISLDFKSGRLSGTPTQAGSFRFSIYAGFWSLYGLSLQFSGVIGPESSTTTTAVVEEEVVADSATEDPATEDTTVNTVTDDSVTDDSVSEDSTTSTTPTEDAPAEIKGETPQVQTVTLVDIVAPDQIVAQVLPDAITRISCDSGCQQLLISRVGLEEGQVFVRVSSTEWVLLDGATESIELAADSGITDIQVKVVSEDGATYVMQGQTQREGADQNSSMSSAIWWLLLALVLLIAVAIIRERRKQSMAS